MGNGVVAMLFRRKAHVRCGVPGAGGRTDSRVVVSLRQATEWMLRRPDWTTGFFCLSFAVVLSAGCQVPPHVQQTVNAPLYDDVMAIMCTIRPKPWVNFDVSDPSRINGLAVNMYLVSAGTQKGVFGAGTIRVMLYEPEATTTTRSGAAGGTAGNVVGKKLHEWVLPPDKAMPFRVLRRPDKTYVMGDGYQLRLPWGDLDLRGKRIALVIEYERTDGRIVRRPPFWLQVPARGQM